jgi:hypothetical protein
LVRDDEGRAGATPATNTQWLPNIPAGNANSTFEAGREIPISRPGAGCLSGVF